MCYLITFALSDSDSPQSPAVVLEKHPVEFHVNSYRNTSGGHRYETDLKSYALLIGGCSCELYVHPDRVTVHLKNMLRKYQKRGWSKTKIKRAIASSSRTYDKTYLREKAGLRSDVRAYLAELAEQYDEVKFIIHYHHDSFCTEPFDLKRTVILSPYQLIRNNPFQVDDVLYIVRRD